MSTQNKKIVKDKEVPSVPVAQRRIEDIKKIHDHFGFGNVAEQDPFKRLNEAAGRLGIIFGTDHDIDDRIAMILHEIKADK